MPISTLWAKSMPSIFSRKPCTKCWRAISPSVTMSTPAASCSFTASMVASRLARASSSPLAFQGAHSMFGSASHSGFGSEPAIVVGNSIGGLPDVLIERLSAMSYARGTGQQKSFRPGIGTKRHDRILLRLLQPVDLSRLPQHSAHGEGVLRGDRVAADPGRRHLQFDQSERLCRPGKPGAGE